MTELHKQRYKAVLTNSGLSVANDKLQEKVEAERQRAADCCASGEADVYRKIAEL